MFAVCDVSLAEVTVEVEAVEVLEDREDDELLRVTTFLCGMNIRDTSSVLIAGKPPELLLAPSQPSLDIDWKVGGEATIVVIDV